jgi:hypothetical protein
MFSRQGNLETFLTEDEPKSDDLLILSIAVLGNPFNKKNRSD